MIPKRGDRGSGPVASARWRVINVARLRTGGARITCER